MIDGFEIGELHESETDNLIYTTRWFALLGELGLGKRPEPNPVRKSGMDRVRSFT